jgi:hypothetical protein
MTRRIACPTIAVIAAAFLAAAWLGTARLAAAEARVAAALGLAVAVERDAERLIALRAARHTVGQGAEPQADALASINAAMVDAGLDPAHLRSLTPEAQPSPDALTGSSGYQRRSLRLSLGAIAMPELGRFLQSWRSTQEIWAVTQIVVRREPARRASSQELWSVTMTLSATYVQPVAPGDTP